MRNFRAQKSQNFSIFWGGWFDWERGILRNEAPLGNLSNRSNRLQSRRIQSKIQILSLPLSKRRPVEIIFPL